MTSPLVIAGPCRDCGSAGRIPEGPPPHYRRGELIVPTVDLEEARIQREERATLPGMDPPLDDGEEI